MDKLAIKNALFYGSWLLLPLVAFLAWRICRGPRRGPWLALLVVTLLFCWARFIEPQWLTVATHSADVGFKARLGLISDLHLGLYKGPAFLQRVVERANTLQLDALLVAGDFIYEPDRPLAELFAPFAAAHMPVYAVRGNHDSGHPPPNVGTELRTALEQAGVHLLENEVVQLPNFKLVGLGDHWAGRDNLATLAHLKPADHVVVLTHNPDTATLLPRAIADLTLAGHTHGGQVRLPWLYRKVIPTQGNFDRGWYDLTNTRLFITSGVGETAVPLRLFVPPVIDVLVLGAAALDNAVRLGKSHFQTED